MMACRSWLGRTAVLISLVAATPGPAATTPLDRFKVVERDAARSRSNATDYGDYSPAGFAQRVAQARTLLARLKAIDRGALSHDYQVTYDLIRWDNDRLVELAPFALLRFPYTPYEWTFRGPDPVLKHFAFSGDQDVDRYLALVERYPAALATVQKQIDAQEKAGIRLPREAAVRVRATLLDQVRTPEQSFAWPDDARLTGLSTSARARLRDGLAQAIARYVDPALTALAARFGPEYQAKASTVFGLAQYAGGKAYYRALVRRELTLEDSPEELFKASQHALDMIESDLKALRGEMGWSGSREAFEDRLRRDPRFIAKTTAEVEATYLDYMRRIDPFMPALFCRPAPYGYGVVRASPAQEAALTFGYADTQVQPERRGIYYYNGANLDQRSLLPAQGLIYHELAPGHYWHDAMRFLSKSMTDYPRRSMAFSESWGDFAQQLAYEQGVFRTPQEKYGRLLFKAMFHARALADIGVNYHGKSFDWALAVLRRYTFESDLQNRSSLIRDTTDWQAQILPYSFGSQAILRLRERVRSELDDRFSEPRFYDAVLMTGGAPFPVLDRHLDWFIEQEKTGRAPGICE